MLESLSNRDSPKTNGLASNPRMNPSKLFVQFDVLKPKNDIFKKNGTYN
jgi:hypothetical protein